jgi:hypothetical protein
VSEKALWNRRKTAGELNHQGQAEERVTVKEHGGLVIRQWELVLVAKERGKTGVDAELGL